MNTNQELNIVLQEADTASENLPPGDCIFMVGRNTDLSAKRREMPGGSFRFFLPDGREALTISPTGDFLVHGNPVANDLEVYETFKAFMECARIEHDRHATTTTP